jgi:hypothetical protein
MTLELTRAEHEAFYTICADNDERDAIEASALVGLDELLEAV